MNENVIEQPVAAMYMVSKELNRLAGLRQKCCLVLNQQL